MIVCWRCGTEHSDERRFCTHCGAELPSGSRPDDPPPEKRPALWLLALVAVVVVGGVAAGGVLLYDHVHHPARGIATAARTSVPTVPLPSTSSPDPSPTASSSPSATPETPSDTATVPSSSAPSSPESSAAGDAAVAVSPAAADDPLAPTAVSLLTDYFAAINTRDYARWRSVFTPDYRAQFTPAGFAGYATTEDTSALVTGISSGAGQEEVNVTFTSTQDPSDGPQGQACTVWQVTFYMEQSGGRYFFGRPPSSYHARFSPC